MFVGAVVRLKSGSPNMTVLAVHGGGVSSSLKVGWTDKDGRYQEMTATSQSFELVEPEKIAGAGSG
jgi:uncharacterized protein YodC (DUF2158 family)